ncbi:MAG: antirepressor [Candidatus Magasanikbacteria bacterium RIFOXYD12_FULL_33_17]|nr:MAG: antirepressor [Candidatus Magasanikbacteria bacterium RIFOXYD12_FULL_33_17]
MKNKTSLAIFENFKVRRIYDEKKEIWYFSIIDVIEILTNTSIPRRYWSDLKSKLKKEGSEVYEKIVQLKMTAPDGKQRKTDSFSTEDLLRIIQSIPSPKAEPFKIWLAKVGYERMQEMTDPERALNRSREYWQKQGRSDKWIQQRMMGQETRNKLTDYWSEHDVKKGDEFAILTNIIHEEWADLSVKDHKNLKGLKTQNLRDHMTEAELIFTALAELSTRQIADSTNAEGLKQNKVPAKKGGKIAKDARRALEKKTGKSVVTGENFLASGKSKKSLK